MSIPFKSSSLLTTSLGVEAVNIGTSFDFMFLRVIMPFFNPESFLIIPTFSVSISPNFSLSFFKETPLSVELLIKCVNFL